MPTLNRRQTRLGGLLTFLNRIFGGTGAAATPRPDGLATTLYRHVAISNVTIDKPWWLVNVLINEEPSPSALEYRLVIRNNTIYAEPPSLTLKMPGSYTVVTKWELSSYGIEQENTLIHTRPIAAGETLTVDWGRCGVAEPSRLAL